MHWSCSCCCCCCWVCAGFLEGILNFAEIRLNFVDFILDAVGKFLFQIVKIFLRFVVAVLRLAGDAEAWVSFLVLKEKQNWLRMGAYKTMRMIVSGRYMTATDIFFFHAYDCILNDCKGDIPFSYINTFKVQSFKHRLVTVLHIWNGRTCMTVTKLPVLW